MTKTEYLKGRCKRCKRWRKLCGRRFFRDLEMICTRCDGCATKPVK